MTTIGRNSTRPNDPLRLNPSPLENLL